MKKPEQRQEFGSRWSGVHWRQNQSVSRVGRWSRNGLDWRDQCKCQDLEACGRVQKQCHKGPAVGDKV